MEVCDYNPPTEGRKGVHFDPYAPAGEELVRRGRLKDIQEGRLLLKYIGPFEPEGDKAIDGKRAADPLEREFHRLRRTGDLQRILDGEISPPPGWVLHARSSRDTSSLEELHSFMGGLTAEFREIDRLIPTSAGETQLIRTASRVAEMLLFRAEGRLIELSGDRRRRLDPKDATSRELVVESTKDLTGGNLSEPIAMLEDWFPGETELQALLLFDENGAAAADGFLDADLPAAERIEHLETMLQRSEHLRRKILVYGGAGHSFRHFPKELINGIMEVSQGEPDEEAYRRAKEYLATIKPGPEVLEDITTYTREQYGDAVVPIVRAAKAVLNEPWGPSYIEPDGSTHGPAAAPVEVLDEFQARLDAGTSTARDDGASPKDAFHTWLGGFRSRVPGPGGDEMLYFQARETAFKLASSDDAEAEYFDFSCLPPRMRRELDRELAMEVKRRQRVAAMRARVESSKTNSSTTD